MKFTAIYDGTSTYFDTANEEYNRYFLLAQTNYLNDLLRVKKILFLNQALDILGLAPVRFGQIYGWAHPEDSEIRVYISRITDGFKIVFDTKHVFDRLEEENPQVLMEEAHESR